MIRHQHYAVAQPALDATFQTNTASAINQRHAQAPCLGSKLNIATSSSAMRSAASFDHRSPFSAVAAEGSPITPLGAMSLVSHAKFADEPSGLS